MKQILKQLQQYKLYVNLKKCTFHIDQMKFFEFIILIKGVLMNQWWVEIIWKWSVLQSYHEIQMFLRFANFYHHFIHEYFKVAAFLTGLLKGNKNEKKTGAFEWSQKAAEAFCKLYTVFMQTPMLAHFNLKLKGQVKTDTSIVRLADIYSQLQTNSQWHSVAFWFKMLNRAESQYKIHNQKLLTIMKTFKHWWHYLKNSQYSIEVLTDHNNLWGFMNVKALNRRQAHWVIKLAAYNFDIIHRSEKTNLADVSLRCSDYKSKKSADRLLFTLQRKLTAISQEIKSSIKTLISQVNARINLQTMLTVIFTEYRSSLQAEDHDC